MRASRLFAYFSLWATRVRLRHKLVIALVMASIMSGLATYAAMTQSTLFGTDPSTILTLSLIDLGLLGVLGTIVALRVQSVWNKRQRNQAGSRLHVRMISVFALMAAVPALLVAMFAAIFFYFGVEAWFSNHVRTSLNASLEVAQAYLEEHKQVLRADTLAMANDLNRQAVKLSGNQIRFAQVVSGQAYLRNLTEVIVFDGAGKILARSGLSFALSLEPITPEMMTHASRGEVVLIVNDNDDRVRALTRLDNFVDTYLFVGRPVEAKVLAHMETTQKAVSEYKQIEGKRFGLQVILSAIFVVVAMLLLLSSVWFGMNFATKLVGPISNLMNATNRVRGGDLTARVQEAEREGEDELEQLGRSFNRMTSQLQTQRSDLMEANRQLDQRRHLIEAVLSGVSAGVIGMDEHHHINLMNAAAAKFLDITDVNAVNGQPITRLLPEIAEIIESMPQQARLHDGHIEVRRMGQPARSLLVRISSDPAEGDHRGYVVTFDDVSDLISAQRKAAWADVARRIAHEIKNPLTPIQLSAERLRRKYGKEIVTEPEVFQTCTDTIIRHVDDIGRMVDEFSAFARMPVPVMKMQDVREICRQTVFLQGTGRADIRYVQNYGTDQCMAECDGRQLAQALTNLLKNAAEAIDGRPLPLQGNLVKGEINISLTVEESHVVLSISDNGKGLPVEERDRLTEPYVTTRTKGTGLGLAIVKKILEDHHGTLTLTDRMGGGAVVTLRWPLRQPVTDNLSDGDESAKNESHIALSSGELRRA